MSESDPILAQSPPRLPSPNGQAGPAPDPFDPAALRVDALADIETEKVLTAVPVRKPGRREFFRVHPGAEYVVDTLLIERDDGLDKVSYLVRPAIHHLVLQELHRVRIFTAITKRGTVFLWPVKLPLEDRDRLRRVSETALAGAEQAKHLWVRLSWNRDLGGYDLFRAKGDLGEPQWPDKSFRDILELAFRHNVIDRPDHDVIRELEGEL